MTVDDMGFTHGILERAGCAIHFWAGGAERGPLVVLTHGAWCDHRMFAPQVPALAARYRLLLWDVRGHGMSRPDDMARFSIRAAADDLLALLDHQGYAQASLVGHSMGGNISQELAFYHPGRVRAMALVGCTCNTAPLSAGDRALLALAAPILRRYPADALRRQSADASALRPEVRTYLREQFATHSGPDLAAILLATTACLHPEPGYAMALPLLLAHGVADATGNISALAPRWARAAPRCRYAPIPGASHCAHQDNPGYFNPVLSTFLNEAA